VKQWSAKLTPEQRALLGAAHRRSDFDAMVAAHEAVARAFATEAAGSHRLTVAGRLEAATPATARPSAVIGARGSAATSAGGASRRRRRAQRRGCARAASRSARERLAARSASRPNASPAPVTRPPARAAKGRAGRRVHPQPCSPSVTTVRVARLRRAPRARRFVNAHSGEPRLRSRSAEHVDLRERLAGEIARWRVEHVRTWCARAMASASSMLGGSPSCTSNTPEARTR
jgi:hypothetical protein